MDRFMLLLSCVCALLAATQEIQAVEYEVINNAANTPGGIRFANEIGVDYSHQTLASATEFIWRVFQQTTEADRKKVPKVTLIVETKDGVAYAVNNEIHLSANYINTYRSGDVKKEITGVLYHEMTHVWQWNGNGKAANASSLIEGIADFVRLKAALAPSHWVATGEGEKWDKGYDVTARFLDYCNDLRNGFVAELNKKMRNDYNVNFFADLLGKGVDQLWSEYKAKYGH